MTFNLKYKKWRDAVYLYLCEHRGEPMSGRRLLEVVTRRDGKAWFQNAPAGPQASAILKRDGRFSWVMRNEQPAFASRTSDQGYESMHFYVADLDVGYESIHFYEAELDLPEAEE
jgi:hypothetical protein